LQEPLRLEIPPQGLGSIEFLIVDDAQGVSRAG
jgi:hypothetical protein